MLLLSTAWACSLNLILAVATDLQDVATGKVSSVFAESVDVADRGLMLGSHIEKSMYDIHRPREWQNLSR